jgi:ribosomal protein L18E
MIDKIFVARKEGKVIYDDEIHILDISEIKSVKSYSPDGKNNYTALFTTDRGEFVYLKNSTQVINAFANFIDNFERSDNSSTVNVSRVKEVNTKKSIVVFDDNTFLDVARLRINVIKVAWLKFLHKIHQKIG